jgi:hypothetical protein
MGSETTQDPADRHRPAIEALSAAVLESPGVLPAPVRRAAAERSEVPETYAAYVGNIHDHAYKITDRTVADLKAAGESEDAVFEVTVAAAYGASRRRLDAGLAALRKALEDS